MPYTQDGLPFARGSHTSFKAAAVLRSEGNRGEKMQRLLRAYREAGARGLTNLEAAAASGLPLQSVCSLRAAAADCELLERCGERVSQFGKPNAVWRLK